MLTLLVLTDFSPAADYALQYAAALAAPGGAHLVLLHVRPSLLSANALTTSSVAETEEDAYALLRQRLLTLPPTLPASAAVVSGEVGAEVAAAVRQREAAVVVVGRPELGSVPDELVHTTSLGLLRHLPCALLVVPLRTAATVPPRRALLAVDDQPLPRTPGTAGLHPLLGHTALTVAFVADEEVAADPARAFANAQQAGLLGGFGPTQERGFAATAPAAGIADATALVQPDLLVLVARRRSLLGRLFHQSVTAAVVREATVPVLVLPEHAD
ncbi:universal stress protein [Hymenobacter sp. 15J16-1T3B]|uniref:universal stress protein n=1 Tax=Hymenobacter sp. 15J16-1T3B TaxID=2886941 RepID=UPI001D114984|nr:universal stress protein [Hymenobacter sp. 15J16-1T3B]MCC3158674.1 universal stress protein [Hymenobacter sp. 15J16-1T3B]